MSPHLGDLELGRLLSGHCSAAEEARIAGHAEGCAACAAELSTARAAQQRFGQYVLPRTLASVEARTLASVEARAAKRRWRLRLPFFAALSAAAAAALVFVHPGPDLSSKGAGAMQVFARRGESVFLVADGARLQAGDRLRFEVEAGEARFVAIGSVDGSGAANVYYPSAPVAQLERPDAGPAALLPGSVELDDAPGPERLFAVFSDAPLPGAGLAQALSALGRAGPAAIRKTRALPLPHPQATLLFEKGGTP